VTWPQPTRSDHDKFCDIEGWTPVRDARGRTGTHHVTYELDLPDGRVLRTRLWRSFRSQASRKPQPVDRSTYGASLWGHILRDQLGVSEAEFWRCVRDRVKPARGVPELPADALPADLVHLLITRVGLADFEVARMSKTEAVERINRFWTEGA
jgi:hypothetical protein